MNSRHPLRNFFVGLTVFLVMSLAFLYWLGISGTGIDAGILAGGTAMFGSLILGLIALLWLIYAIVQIVKRKQK